MKHLASMVRLAEKRFGHILDKFESISDIILFFAFLM